MVAHEVLEDHADAGAHVVQVVVAQVAPVQQDPALVGVVQPRQQLHQRGLAGAVLADQRQHLARGELEVQPAQRPFLGVRIAEAHVLEREAARDRPRYRHGTGRAADLRLDLEERIQVVQVQRLSGDLREADQQALEQLSQAAEAAGQEGQVADGEIAADRAPGDVGIGDVVAQGSERGQQRAPERAPPRQRAVGAEELLRQLAETGDEEAVEAEDLDLFRGLHAGAHLPDVLELPAFRRPLEVERVIERVEMRFADERRHQRDRQQHDQPGGVDEQSGREAHHGHRVLRLPEQLAHQVHAAHGLAPRAVQLVLQVGVLEVLQVERGGVLHQPDAGGVGEQLRQRRVGVAHQPAEHVRADRQSELQQQQPQQVRQLAAFPRRLQRVEAHARADQAHHLVDDQLADVQGDDGHQRPHQAQAHARERQRPAGAPDLAQERRQVLQRAEAFLQAGVRAGSAGAGSGIGGGRGHGAIVRQGRLAGASRNPKPQERRQSRALSRCGDRGDRKGRD